MAQVKALKDFDFSPNGIDVQSVRKDQVVNLPDDLVSGLSEAGTVEEVKAEPTPAEELQPIQRAGVVSDRPDIEPVEHGGDTPDRVLSKEGQQPTDPSRDVETEQAVQAAGAKAIKDYENKALTPEESKEEAAEGSQAEQSKRGRKPRA